MAVDYTKVFTVIGQYADEVRDYYAYIATFNTNKAAIETVLGAQSVVYLGDGLTDMFDSFKDNVSGWMDDLIGRVTTVLTDEALIGANFSFGAEPTLSTVFPTLIHDMVLNDKNVTASVATVGSITYTTKETNVGKLLVGTKLDGVTPPIAGAQPITDYAGLTTQLTPTAETLTFTCVTDSEHGTARGSESFEITGTGPQSDHYDPLGYNIGTPGSITVADNQAAQYVVNPSFDTWTADEPDGWTVGSGVGGVSFDEDATNTLTGEGSSLKIIGAASPVSIELTQELSLTTFERQKAYFLSFWCRKLTDALADTAVEVEIDFVSSDPGAANLILQATPTSTSWIHTGGQFVIPYEMSLIVIKVRTDAAMDSDLNDPVLIDQIVITPCEYHAGVAVAIFGGPDQFLQGDTISVPLSNNNAGEFQKFFRQAYAIQLPTDPTPTISDSLVS
jgi:hypothetical protein